MSDLKKANGEIAEAVTGGFQKIEDGVVGGYRKIESTVAGAYKQVEDAFAGRFLTREWETAEDAKARLSEKETAREEQAQKRAAEQKALLEDSKKTGRP